MNVSNSVTALKTIKKWWTAGASYSSRWYWYSRDKQTHLFGGFWADRRSSYIAPMDQCIYLDANYEYFWRNISCGVNNQSPTHHFICEHNPKPLITQQDTNGMAQRLQTIDQSGESKILPIDPQQYNHQPAPEQDHFVALGNIFDQVPDNSSEQAP